MLESEGLRRQDVCPATLESRAEYSQLRPLAVGQPRLKARTDWLMDCTGHLEGQVPPAVRQMHFVGFAVVHRDAVYRDDMGAFAGMVDDPLPHLGGLVRITLEALLHVPV